MSILVGTLVERDYAGVERLTQGRRFTAEQLRTRLRSLTTEPLTRPPSFAEAEIGLVRVGVDPESWRIRMPLWSAGRRTGLVATFTTTNKPNGTHHNILDDVSYDPEFRPGPDAVPQAAIAAEEALWETQWRAQQCEEAERRGCGRNRHRRHRPLSPVRSNGCSR